MALSGDYYFLLPTLPLCHALYPNATNVRHLAKNAARRGILLHA
jgi:hypothetical protein